MFYLNAGMMQGGLEEQRIKGTPLGNSRKSVTVQYRVGRTGTIGHCLVRYADDMKIFAGSLKRTEIAKAGISRLSAIADPQLFAEMPEKSVFAG